MTDPDDRRAAWNARRPPHRNLPGRRALNLYGEVDHLGGLNLLTPARTSEAAKLVKTGEVFSLNAPIDYPSPHPGSVRRKPATHVVVNTPRGRDDYLDGFWPQYGSQWDHFLHVRDIEHDDCSYNGNTDSSIGMEVWAQRGIAGRGVLLDVARWREAQGRPINWRVREEVSIEDLVRCAADAAVEIRDGTILIVRFGWETGWLAAPCDERRGIRPDNFQSPGLEASPAMVAHLWDWGVAAVAADNFALEPFPIDIEGGYFMHLDLLVRAGIPIGEFWHLDDLAKACARHGRHEFLVTSAPLNVAGGTGSPANALAIL